MSNTENRDKKLSEVIDDCVAIIGMAGRFPGANNVKQLWENLCVGKESITFFSDDELLAAGISSTELDDPAYVKAKGLVQDVDKFDAKFFGILPKDAIVLDPQQRILLESVATALEDAGYYSEETAGRVAVYAGCGFNTYYPKIMCHNPEFTEATGDFQSAIGNGNDFLSTRISYKFNFTGPSITVQTACSTSLVAVTQAYNSLLAYQCDMAVAGGASAFFPIKSGYHYQKELIFSADGHCRALDAEGTGTLFGMGVGVVILKRLADALKDNDHIYAVIRGAAINNDGANKVGFTAPAEEGQRQVIVEAQTLAQIDPATIRFIEAHATATPIGDPIEVAALTAAMQPHTENQQYCALGTLKANIGHLDAAAGVAGLIKTILVLNNKKIPPAANFKHAAIDFTKTPFYVPTQLEEWQTPEGKPRRAGVSSFGVGGTNVHMVLEEAPAIEQLASTSKPYYLFSVSARTVNALKQRLLDLERFIAEQGAEHSIEEVSYTLNVGRKPYEQRCVVVASSLPDLHDILYQVNQGRQHPNYLDQQTTVQESASQLQQVLEESQAVDADRYRETLLALGALFLQGSTEIDWERLHAHESKRRISLPTYPFERVRYWVPEVAVTAKVIAPEAIYFYHPVWKPEAAAQQEKQYKDASLLLIHNKPLTKNFETSMEKFFKDVITYSLSFDQSIDYNKLLHSLAEKNQFPQRVVYYMDLNDSIAADALQKSFYTVIFFVQALLRVKLVHPVEIIFCYESRPNSFVEPFLKALSGLWRTIAEEYPNVRGKLLSVDQATVKNLVVLTKSIVDAFASQEKEIAYLEEQRYVKRVEEIQFDNVEMRIPFRMNGVYVITGGASGLGWIIASHLVTTYKARLLLVGRTELIESKIYQINQLVEKGGEVFYQRADVGSRDDLTRVLAFAHQQFGSLNGVIHCAGVIHDALLMQKQPPDIAEVLSAKILGTLNLDELTSHDALDCFVLFSSVVAEFGNIGQSDYAYANGFMDAFAQTRALSKRPGKTISINWPAWEQGGMQLTPAARAWLKKTFNTKPLATAQGLWAFEQICARVYSQVIVLTGDKEKIAATLIAESTPKSAISSENDVTQKLISLLSEVSSLAVSEIQIDVSLFEMGLDSIILAQLISKAEQEFDLTLDEVLHEILLLPTIANIAQFISDKDQPVKVSQQESFSDQIVILRK